MCLAVPAEVLELRENDMALVSIGGAQREINVMLLEDALSIGDYVLVHVGFAIERVDPEEAMKTLDLLRQLSLAEDDVAEDDAPANDTTADDAPVNDTTADGGGR
jgi:hydrogenase expression/formation protein HypC